MHAVKMLIASLKTTLVYVLVNQAQLVIHFSVVFQFNIVASTINAHRERFVKPEFVVPFVHRIEIVSMINYVCKVFANQHVMIIQLALISNSVKTIFAHKKFDAVPMMIVH